MICPTSEKKKKQTSYLFPWLKKESTLIKKKKVRISNSVKFTIYESVPIFHMDLQALKNISHGE